MGGESSSSGVMSSLRSVKASGVRRWASSSMKRVVLSVAWVLSSICRKSRSLLSLGFSPRVETMSRRSPVDLTCVRWR